VSDTPRMDYAAGHARGIVDAAIIAEGMNLERELNAASQRIKRLENIINEAWAAFFPHSSHREAAIAMHRILDEEVRKESQ